MQNNAIYIEIKKKFKSSLTNLTHGNVLYMVGCFMYILLFVNIVYNKY